MPVTQDDLWVVNADATDLAKLGKALEYIQTAMPLYGKPAIDELACMNIRIEINHEGVNQYDSHDKVIRWDPNFGLELSDMDGQWVGVNSAAAVLLHEVNHARDPNYLQNLNTPNQRWLNDAERWAAQATNGALREAGEAERMKYEGDLLVRAPDPTERTMHFEYFDEFNYSSRAEQVWVEMDQVIGTAFGDVFEMADLSYGMPSIGGGFVIRGFLMPEIEPDSTSFPVDDPRPEESAIEIVGLPSPNMILGDYMFA